MKDDGNSLWIRFSRLLRSIFPSTEERQRRAEEALRRSAAANLLRCQQEIADRAKRERESRRNCEVNRDTFDGELPASPELPPGIGGFLEGPGDFAVEAVGESHYQEALEALLINCGENVEADLILEDTNPHDHQAVQIQIMGCVCGHLSREDARSYRRRLREAGHPRLNLRCQAMITGKGPFGVRLDLPYDGSGQSFEAWRDDPATEAQKSFADSLGIEYRPDITKGELSDRIDKAIGRR